MRTEDARMLREGKACEICGKGPEGVSTVIDHCHATRVIRGVLCTTCNGVLGLFRDDPERFEAAARYLRR